MDSFKVHSVSKNFVRYFAQPLSLAKKVTLRNVSVVPIWACRLAGSNQYLETGTLAITQGCIYFGKIWSVWQINDSLYVYELCNI